MKSKDPRILILTVLIVGLSSAHAAKPALESEIEKDLIALSAGEKERDEAVKRLSAKPAAEVKSALKTQLLQATSQVFALRALAELGGSYRTPEIDKAVQAVAKKSNAYEVFDAVNLTVNKTDRHLHKLYLDRLGSLVGKKKNSPLKSSLLNGLAKMEEPLSDGIYGKLLADDDYTVRETAIRHFLATREFLSQKSQAVRFRISLKTQPFQARLVAMEAFANLPLPELKALAEAFDNSQCATEKFEETRKACEAIRESLKKSGAK